MPMVVNNEDFEVAVKEDEAHLVNLSRENQNFSNLWGE